MENFNYWLPLIINDNHAQRALPYIKATIGIEYIFIFSKIYFNFFYFYKAALVHDISFTPSTYGNPDMSVFIFLFLFIHFFSPFLSLSIAQLNSNYFFFQIIELRLQELANNFHPLMVLKVLPKLMNNTIVSMMKNQTSETEKSEQKSLNYPYLLHNAPKVNLIQIFYLKFN